MKKTMIAVSMLVLSGCANLGQPDYRMWLKPGNTVTASEKDRRECNYDAQKVFLADINSPLRARFLGEQMFEYCMVSRGYALR